MESKTIKGQAWIQGNSLVQDQILITTGGQTSENVIVLIENIWDDLKSDSGTYKTNDKGYFYWEYEMTDSEDDDVTVTVKIECPKPKEGLFTEPYDPDSYNGKYAKYWVEKFKTAAENYEYKAAIQKKEIVFPGTEYVNPNDGSLVTVKEMKVKNTDIGDITNLLNLF